MKVPIVLVAGLVRAAIRLLSARGHAVAAELIELRHPDSDGGRKITPSERRALVRTILLRVAELDSQEDLRQDDLPW